MKGQPQVEWRPYKGLLVGVLVSLGIMLLSVGLLAFMISKGSLQESSIGYAVLAILLLSSALGASMAVGITEKKRLFTGIVTTLAYGLCLLACTALFFGGEYQGVGVTLLVLLAGGILPALIGSKEKKRFKGVWKNR